MCLTRCDDHSFVKASVKSCIDGEEHVFFKIRPTLKMMTRGKNKHLTLITKCQVTLTLCQHELFKQTAHFL